MNVIENEQTLADKLRTAFPDIYLHVKLTTPKRGGGFYHGYIEISPSETEDDSGDLITISGENRFTYATNICNQLLATRLFPNHQPTK